MINRYVDLIEQTFYFPQEGFEVKDNSLLFNDIPIQHLIDVYGTPFKLTYLPKIRRQIQKARALFRQAFRKNDYKGNYHYCYCTKSNHFSYILNEVLKQNVPIETSSEFDIYLIKRLFSDKRINQQTIIINNGFKPKRYMSAIVDLIHDGFEQVIPILDNVKELDYYLKNIQKKTISIGVRVAAEEEPNFEFYTSRLGIRYSNVIHFYQEKIANNSKLQLKMLHFFIDTGIKDTIYYWSEFKKMVKLYCDLKKICPSLSAINIGGGMPIKNSLGFEYDYKYMVNEIVWQIKEATENEGIEHPDIFTEFGRFTVGESGATIFSVLEQKQQNDAEKWYMIDNSLMATLPDTWGISERFILLPINYWDKEYERVNIGGLSCDNADYYNAEAHINQVYLPKIDADCKEPLYIGFFHTGAYQEAISGYGGVKHCLIPAPKQILIDRDQTGNLTHQLYAKEQTAEEMLKILGY